MPVILILENISSASFTPQQRKLNLQKKEKGNLCSNTGFQRHSLVLVLIK